MSATNRFSQTAATARYNERRRQVYQQVTQEVTSDTDLPPCRLGPILTDALKTWRQTWLPRFPRPEGLGEWDWSKLVVNYRQVDALTLAIWSGTALCGLMAARPSTKHTRLRLEYIEASPDPSHPLRGHVLDIGMLVAVRYAQVIGAGSLRLINPAPGLISQYQERYGFGLVGFDGGWPYSDVRI